MDQWFHKAELGFPYVRFSPGLSVRKSGPGQFEDTQPLDIYTVVFASLGRPPRLACNIIPDGEDPARRECVRDPISRNMRHNLKLQGQ